MADYLDAMTLDDLKAMMVAVLTSNPPASDREFIHRLANAIVAKGKAAQSPRDGGA